MPIVDADIQWRLSGGAANADPNASLGGAMSSVVVAAGLHNLFDSVSSAEASAGDTEYRGIYVRNGHGSLTWTAVVLWILSQLAGGADSEIALAVEAVGVTMATIANESTAPAGVTFSVPTQQADALQMGNVPFGSFKGIWIKRIVPAAAGAVSADNAQLRAEGTTLA